MASGLLPAAHLIPGLALSGPKPFYASFEASAKATVRMLKPKTLGGYSLPGKDLATALAAVVPQINSDRPASLHTAVYASLRSQANDAVAAGVRMGIDALQAALVPVAETDEELAQALASEAAVGEED